MATEIALFTAASESFSRKNTNCSIAESMARLQTVAGLASNSGMRIRAYISCVLGCPYEGNIEAATVVSISEQLLQMGCDEISLGDTIGTGTPAQANALVERVSDTYGQALANILACLDAGITTVDASVAGLGGCPYAHGASGNVATEDVVYMLHGLGLETGIDLPALAATGNWISKKLGRSSNSKAGTALFDKQ
jgi:isopropylmalate/homocitrate/citramalate synthase